jgi:hypothetical protein
LVNIDIGIVTVRTFCRSFVEGGCASIATVSHKAVKNAATIVRSGLSMAHKSSKDNNICRGFYEIYDAIGLNQVSAAAKVNLSE